MGGWFIMDGMVPRAPESLHFQSHYNKAGFVASDVRGHLVVSSCA